MAAVATLLAYAAANRRFFSPPSTLPLFDWEKSLPYLPRLMGPYLLTLPAFMILVYRCAREDFFDRLFRALLFATGLHLLVYFSVPILYPRPDATDSLARAYYFWDSPACCFPALPLTLSLILATVCARKRARGPALIAALLAFMAAVGGLLCKQHYAWDLLASCVVAAFYAWRA